MQRSTAIYTDKHPSYTGLDKLGYEHGTIDHAEKYVDGLVHTNGLENFWSLLKRGLARTYVSVGHFTCSATSMNGYSHSMSAA